MKPMKKTMRLMMSVLACGLLLLTSCSKSAKLAAYIPDDAFMVVNVNAVDLMQKMDVENIDNISFVKLARQELKSEDPKMAELVDKIIADPLSTGLNLKEDMLAYVTLSNEYNALVAMHKESKFEDFLTQFAKDEEYEISITEKDGFKVATIDGSEALAFNGKVLAIGSAAQNPGTRLKLDKDQSLADNDNFEQYWKTHSEIGFWMAFEPIFKTLKMMGRDDDLVNSGLPEEYIDALEDAAYSINLVFDKGAFRMVVNTQGIDPKDWKVYQQDFNADLVNLMPETCYATLASAVKIDEMVKMLSNMKDAVDINEEIADNITVKDLLQSLNGSVLVSLFDIVQMDESSVVPMLAIAADVNNAATIKNLLAKLGLTQQDGLYVIPDFGLGTDAYIALNDKAVYLTNSKEAANQFLAGGYKNGMKNVAQKVKKGNFFYADLNVNHYPAPIVKLIPSNIVTLLGGYFDYLECGAISSTSAECTIHLVESKENSLLFTLHYIDKNLVELANLAESLEEEVDSYGLGNTDGDTEENYEEEIWNDGDFEI